MRILIVEDLKELRESLTTVIENNGIEVVAACRDGEHALETLASGVVVDLILSDFCMPNLDGLNLLARLRRAGNQTPFVVFSSEPDLSVFTLAGAEATFHKPDAKPLLAWLRARKEAA